MTRVLPVHLSGAAPVRKTSPVSRVTRSLRNEEEESLLVDVELGKKGRRPPRRADGAFKPSSAQSTSSGAVLDVLSGFKLGGE